MDQVQDLVHGLPVKLSTNTQTCVIDDSPETITVGRQVLLDVPDGHLDHGRLCHVHVDQLQPGAGLHSQPLRPLTGSVVASSKDNTSETVKMPGNLMTNA